MLDGIDPAVLGVLSTTFSLVFGFWPIVLAGLAIERGGTLGRVSLWAWGSFAAMRLYLLRFPSSRFSSLLIPEPYSTILFLVTGAVLIAVQSGVRFWRRRTLHPQIASVDTEADLQNLSRREFEEMVAELYRTFGHRAKRIRSTREGGVDVVVRTKNGERWFVQCRRGRSLVDEGVVREFYALLQRRRADSGAIVTTGRFAAQTRDWARGKPLYLYDGEEFLAAWARAHPQDRPEWTD